VLRLPSTDGVRSRFNLGCCPFGDIFVTSVRVRYDGRFYELQSSMDDGVRIARYSLG